MTNEERASLNERLDADYPTLAQIPLGLPVRITRDGEEVAVVDDANAAFGWLVMNTTGSASWALLNGGYACEALPPAAPRVIHWPSGDFTLTPAQSLKIAQLCKRFGVPNTDERIHWSTGFTASSGEVLLELPGIWICVQADGSSNS